MGDSNLPAYLSFRRRRRLGTSVPYRLYMMTICPAVRILDRDFVCPRHRIAGLQPDRRERISGITCASRPGRLVLVGFPSYSSGRGQSRDPEEYAHLCRTPCDGHVRLVVFGGPAMARHCIFFQNRRERMFETKRASAFPPAHRGPRPHCDFRICQVSRFVRWIRSSDPLLSPDPKAGERSAAVSLMAFFFDPADRTAPPGLPDPLCRFRFLLSGYAPAGMPAWKRWA